MSLSLGVFQEQRRGVNRAHFRVKVCRMDLLHIIFPAGHHSHLPFAGKRLTFKLQSDLSADGLTGGGGVRNDPQFPHLRKHSGMNPDRVRDVQFLIDACDIVARFFPEIQKKDLPAVNLGLAVHP